MARPRACLIAAVTVGILLTVMAVLVVGMILSQLNPSDSAANADLRAALRRDSAFQLIPPGVRSSLAEQVPHAGFVGPEVGLNGFSGVEQAAADDAGPTITSLDGRLRPLGWQPAGGVCIEPGDPVQREVGGIWSKQIQGRWAFFIFALAGSEHSYAIYIRPLADRAGADPSSFSNFQPGPLGCAGPA